MLTLKSPLLFGIFFLVISLSAPLVAGPFERKKKKFVVMLEKRKRGDD